MNYYPFHLGDYAAHTAHLEPMEDLAYRRMLDVYYMREGPLPSNAAECARLVRLRANVADVEAVLNEFFTLTGDGWRHFRCDEEIERMQHKQAMARASAVASVNARKAKAQPSLGERETGVERTLSDRTTDVELPTPTPTPTPTPVQDMGGEPPKPPARAKPPKAALDEAGMAEFEAAWAEYPKRPGNSKAEALKAWIAQLKSGSTVEQMTEGVRRYAAYCVAQKTEPRFIKQAATFFGPMGHFDCDWTPSAPRQEPIQATFHERQLASKRAEFARITGQPIPGTEPQREIIDITPRQEVIANA